MEMINKLWIYGTKEPIQRVGLIILVVGGLSFFSWIFKNDLYIEEAFTPRYFPETRDALWFHLYLYFIPLGILMTWGYSSLIKLINWIMGGNKKKPVNTNILYFKDNEGAFEVAAAMHDPVFSEKSMCIGIVRYIDPQEGSGIVIELAGSDEPLHVMGFNDKHANSVELGDLVTWGFVDYSDENILNIKAVGHILAILKPEFTPHTKKWGIKKDLTQ